MRHLKRTDNIKKIMQGITSSLYSLIDTNLTSHNSYVSYYDSLLNFNDKGKNQGYNENHVCAIFRFFFHKFIDRQSEKIITN